MINFIWSLSFFIIALGILVAVHEWGHFYVARRCGVKVQRFSIGFGKALWSRVGKSGTEYVIAAIPLGGYVKMLDERVDEVAEEDLPYAFNRQHVLKRIAIIAAGPGVNFIFAVFALMLMYMIGVQSVKPVLGEIPADSIAGRGQLEAGMQITGIGGKPAADWEAINLELISHIGKEQMRVTVQPGNSNVTADYWLDIRDWQFDPDKESALGSLGMLPFRPRISTELAQIAEDSPASFANLRQGDKIIALDGTPATEWTQIVEYVATRPAQTVQILLEREGRQLTKIVTIAERETDNGVKGFLGVVPLAEPWPDGYIITKQYGVVGGLLEGAKKTWRLMTLSVEMIGKLFTGDVSVKNLSGPISIAQGAGTSAGYGIVSFLSFLALISVNLGIINLLPLPVLDGGHLLYYFIELLSGKPVPEAVQEVGYKIGGVLLMLLMTIAIVNDIARL